MSGTLEVIQLLQCSSQLLQKSRDNYCSRFAEQERLRREGSPQKEMDKVRLMVKMFVSRYVFSKVFLPLY